MGRFEYQQRLIQKPAKKIRNHNIKRNADTQRLKDKEQHTQEKKIIENEIGKGIIKKMKTRGKMGNTISRKSLLFPYK